MNDLITLKYRKENPLIQAYYKHEQNIAWMKQIKIYAHKKNEGT